MDGRPEIDQLSRSWRARRRRHRVRHVWIPLDVADLLIRVREIDLQRRIAAGFARQRIEIAQRARDEQLTRGRRPGHFRNRVVQFADQRVGELTDVVEPALGALLRVPQRCRRRRR